MTSIGVKSKYGSCSGNCTGLIKINSEAIYSIQKNNLKGISSIGRATVLHAVG
jgi:hypothetical protein